MNEILLFIVEHLSFLYYEYGFKFVDSGYERGNSYLRLSDGELDIAFTREKSQIFLDFISKYDKSEYNLNSIDLIRQLVEGNEKKHYSSLLERENHAVFLKENFQKIQNKYQKKNIKQTLKELDRLSDIRAKHLFG